MKLILKLGTFALAGVAVAAVVILAGCGQDYAKNAGCPSGSYPADITDQILAPADATHTFTVPPFSAGVPTVIGPVLVTPMTFVVTDSTGKFPRNGICVIAYTDGTFYTANDYLTLRAPDLGISFVALTDDTGTATFYWKTAPLPAANPAISSGGVPPTFTAGADKTGTSFVQVYSGPLSHVFSYNWTVKGQEGP